MIRLRKQFKVFGRGTMEFLSPANRKVLAYVRRYGDDVILCVANLSRHGCSRRSSTCALRWPDAGRDAGVHGIPDDRRGALFSDARAVWLLLVRTPAFRRLKSRRSRRHRRRADEPQRRAHDRCGHRRVARRTGALLRHERGAIRARRRRIHGRHARSGPREVACRRRSWKWSTPAPAPLARCRITAWPGHAAALRAHSADGAAAGRQGLRRSRRQPSHRGAGRGSSGSSRPC